MAHSQISLCAETTQQFPIRASVGQQWTDNPGGTLARVECFGRSSCSRTHFSVLFSRLSSLRIRASSNKDLFLRTCLQGITQKRGIAPVPR